MNNGKEFFQELFEDKLVYNIIPQHLRLGAITMMKRKSKTPIEEQVDKPIKKKPMSKAKESQTMLRWMKLNSNKLKWAK